MAAAGALPAASGLRHQALVWRDAADSLQSALAFVREGISRSEPVSVCVRAALGGALAQVLRRQPLVAFFDMAQVGRNPGRLIPAMLDFAGAHASRTLRYVSEPLWTGRSAAERAETVRHEALIGLALADVSATVLCLYDGGMDQPAISCAEQTHSVIIADGQSRPSSRYAGHGIMPEHCDRPLQAPPDSSQGLPYRTDLRAIRAAVTSCARQAGLSDDRSADLALAASEVAANTLRHTDGGGMLHVWRTPGEVICQITDSGRIADPLAGRRRPASDTSGQGLWVVNQLCDLVELRSGPDGTTVRMHMCL
jgi:anti-sigma regulatory factor (Ser/Thr protein kinase)